MSSLFNELLVIPLFNLLIFLYETIAFYDLGIAIIILTILIKLALFPLSHKAIKNQKELFAIQPEIKKIQERYKDNREEQAKKMMALYKEKNVNPFSGCLPILIQLPILIALYWVFLAGFDENMLSNLYSFIKQPSDINHMFLGFLDISEKSIIIALIAGFFQFLQSKMILDQQMKNRKNMPSPEKGSFGDISISVSKQMTYVMPIITVLISYSLHAGIAIYWATTAAFSALQQKYVFQKKEENN